MPANLPGRAPRPRRERERGFALLLVFALAASIAILIYLEIPRVAFERQRDKEALLIDRGEQYSRAIELYARKMNKNPQTLDDLEHAQTVRFLRRRYKDPMTGQDEWRLIHVNALGQYTDSKTHKAAGANEKENSGPSVLASKIQGIGQSATILSGENQVSAALQKRASDRISPGTPGAGPDSGGAPRSGTGEYPSEPNPDQSQQQQGDNAAGGAATGAGGAEAGGTGATQDASPNAPRFPGMLGSGANANSPSPSPSATPALTSTLPGATDASQSGTMQQNNAAQAIQAIIGAQSTRGTGSTGTTGSGVGASGGAAAPSALGPGLVGVATKLEMEGIRSYKDHTNYSEWEFIFDPRDAQGKSGQAGSKQNSAQSGAAAMFGGMPGGNAAPASGGRFN